MFTFTDENREELTAILQEIEENKMPHPRHLDAAIDAIQAIVQVQDAWDHRDPPEDGIYLCHVEAPPQSFRVQGVRRRDGRWLTSWPVLGWKPYPLDL
jgi:hypothetical protein